MKVNHDFTERGFHISWLATVVATTEIKAETRKRGNAEKLGVSCGGLMRPGAGVTPNRVLEIGVGRT